MVLDHVLTNYLLEPLYAIVATYKTSCFHYMGHAEA
jgi:hypothetical protein